MNIVPVQCGINSQNYRCQNGKVRFLIRPHLKAALLRRIEESSIRREGRVSSRRQIVQEQGGCKIYFFCNFAKFFRKFLISCFIKFSLNFAKFKIILSIFCKIQNYFVNKCQPELNRCQPELKDTSVVSTPKEAADAEASDHTENCKNVTQTSQSLL